MILDENEVLQHQNSAEQKYLKILRIWGFSILFGGIATGIIAICLILKLVLTASLNKLIIILLFPFSMMAFAAIRSGLAFIQTPRNYKNQEIGLRWLKRFWGLFIIMIILLFFNAN
ncbi:MAG: hypothetical protein ACI94Y_001874 [Maribacter sp.]|jgi:hypothetical protein